MENNGRLAAPDYVRAGAMLAVIAIHVTSTFTWAPSGLLLWGVNPATLLNQLTIFAVPLFILLSGFSLGLSRRGTGSCPAFLKARLPKLLIPYVIWSLLYWYLDSGRAGAPLSDFFPRLLKGASAPQLYFVIILLQLYLLYPLLRVWCRKAPAGFLAVCSLVSYLLIWSIYLAAEGRFSLGTSFPGRNLWLLFPTWLFYFGLGLFLGERGAGRVSAFAGKHLPLFLPITAVTAIAVIRMSLLTNHRDAFKPFMLVYAPLVFFTLLGLGERLQAVRPVQKAVSFLARRSMTVYFCHILVLRYLRKVPLLMNGTRGMCLLLIAETLLSLLLAWAIDAAVSAIRRAVKPKKV